VFGYSDEDGTEAESLPDHLPQSVVDERVARLTDLVEELTAQRAEERYGELVEVLVDAVVGGVEGRTAGQAPEVDGSTTLTGPGTDLLAVGDLVRARVVAARAWTWWPSWWSCTARPVGRRPWGERARRDDDRSAPGQRLEHRQLPHRAAAAAGAGVPGAAAGPRGRGRRAAARRGGVFLLAAVTDRVDGQIARSRGWSPPSARWSTRSPTRR
jgi:hypothetical protein